MGAAVESTGRAPSHETTRQLVWATGLAIPWLALVPVPWLVTSWPSPSILDALVFVTWTWPYWAIPTFGAALLTAIGWLTRSRAPRVAAGCAFAGVSVMLTITAIVVVIVVVTAAISFLVMLLT